MQSEASATETTSSPSPSPQLSLIIFQLQPLAEEAALMTPPSSPQMTDSLPDLVELVNGQTPLTLAEPLVHSLEEFILSLTQAALKIMDYLAALPQLGQVHSSALLILQRTAELLASLQLLLLWIRQLSFTTMSSTHSANL
jgi:hypothetical protein